MLEVKPITPPACLAGQSNGKLDPAILVATLGLAGGPVVRLVQPAMRAWQALAGTAQQAGIILAATSVGDSYRWYDLQRSTFVLRYSRELTTYGCKRWDSDGNGVAELWCKKDPDLATAAVPGNSNHGWGLAVDVANAAGARLDWLEAHALEFGWSWELVPEEPWHIHYFAGDAIPAAVLAYEQQGDDMAQCLVRFADDPAEPLQVWLCDGQFRRRCKPEWIGANGQGPITNTQVHGAGLLGPLGNNGKVFVSGGDKDVWGIDIATLQGGSSGGLTFEQAKQAAFEGAQQAEDE